jgi:hypothetical protein
VRLDQESNRLDVNSFGSKLASPTVMCSITVDAKRWIAQGIMHHREAIFVSPRLVGNSQFKMLPFIAS